MSFPSNKLTFVQQTVDKQNPVLLKDEHVDILCLRFYFFKSTWDEKGPQSHSIMQPWIQFNIQTETQAGRKERASETRHGWDRYFSSLKSEARQRRRTTSLIKTTSVITAHDGDEGSAELTSVVFHS